MTVRHLLLRLIWVIVLMASLLAGCGDGSAGSGADSTASELVRAWQADRLQLVQETEALKTVLGAKEDDLVAVILIWAGTAAALGLVILLLTRQKRAQQVLSRLFKLMIAPRESLRSADKPLQPPRKEAS